MFSSAFKIIPFVFFGIPSLFIFGLFVSGAFTLFFTDQADRGRDLMARALTYFLILLALLLVFAIVSYLIQQSDIFNPPEQVLEFPMSPMGRFPAAPEFVMAGDYSFSGPWLLSEHDLTEERYVYGIFCKKDENYDIIDLGTSSNRKPISSSENYQCWEETCNGSENIYVGFYWTPPKEGVLTREAFKEIEQNLDFICNP